jgi:hypothetical protein
MAKGNLLLLGGIATVAALALNKNSGTNRSANIGSTLKDTLDLTDAASLAKIISGSPDLQKYLKKIAASNVTHPTVQEIVNNVNNTCNLDGVQYQNFGDSLLVNGAFELEDFSHWVENASVELLDNGNKNKILKFNATTVFYTESRLKLRNDILYKFEHYGKVDSGNYSIAGGRINKDGTLLPVLGTSAIVLNNNNFAQTSFNKRTSYFGGNANLTFCLGDAYYFYFYINNISGVNTQIKDLVLTPVSLGEPVPSNLPWLPQGQMVYDVTTWEVGIYNGTTITWFAA